MPSLALAAFVSVLVLLPPVVAVAVVVGAEVVAGAVVSVFTTSTVSFSLMVEGSSTFCFSPPSHTTKKDRV